MTRKEKENDNRLWKLTEIYVLKQAVLFYGMGDSMSIYKHRCLPKRSLKQINHQIQRLLGKQSTAEYSGIHMDIIAVGEINRKKTGDDIYRKNGMITNKNKTLSKEEIIQRIKNNKKLYELDKKHWKCIKLPTPKSYEIMNQIFMLKKELVKKKKHLKELQERRDFSI